MIAAVLRRDGVRGSLLIAPATLLLLLLFFYPIMTLFATTLEPQNVGNYARILGNTTYLQVFLNSLRIAVIVTVVDLLIAFPLAFYINRLTPTIKTVAFFLVIIPLWTSQLVRTYAWMVLLGRQGPVNETLKWLGLIDTPLRLANTEFAVVIGMVHIMLPYMVLPIYSSVAKIDRSLVEASSGLGAGPISILWRVLIPLTMNGVLAGVSLVFILSLGVFIMPALLGGGRVPVVPLLIEQQAGSFLNWAMAGTFSVILLVLVFAVFWLMKIISKALVRGNIDA